MALLAVPNVSEGRDADQIRALEAAFTDGAELLDRHTDADHNRTVFSLAAATGRCAGRSSRAPRRRSS